jgi:hypothetical protein
MTLNNRECGVFLMAERDMGHLILVDEHQFGYARQGIANQQNYLQARIDALKTRSAQMLLEDNWQHFSKGNFQIGTEKLEQMAEANMLDLMFLENILKQAQVAMDEADRAGIT